MSAETRPSESDEELLRTLAPQVLAAVARRSGRFDDAEDAVQEALLAAASQWPTAGRPDDSRAWLIRVASRRMIDAARRDGARRRREQNDILRTQALDVPDEDDTLTLLFLCCHPALTPASQIALTLRAVGGLTTAEIARAFLVPETTMGQRISRAKARIKDAGSTFTLPPEAERSDRLRAVLHTLYLVYNEGYAATEGEDLQRRELTGEAIRLARLVHAQLPDDGEVAGLLALMLLTEARSAARVDAGELVPLDEQDRSSWDRARIGEGVALVTAAMESAPLGPYQLQAAIAALHDEAPTPADTDWPQILALYDLLARLADNPVVLLNRAVAVAMVRGPAAGLGALDELDGDPRIAGHHRLLAVRAHLLDLAGDRPAAAAHYRAAATATASAPERRYLEAKAAAHASGG
jgi:RNA polymerase sigma factor (sigma-70 family)